MTRRARTPTPLWPAPWFIAASNMLTYACGWFGAAWMFVNLYATLELVILAVSMLGLPKGIELLAGRVLPSSSASPPKPRS